jgi:hypothetical protein
MDARLETASVILGSNVALDCQDARAVATFWRALLRYESPEPTEAEYAAALVEHPEWNGLAVVDEDRHRHPRIFLQTVPEPKVEPNRIRPTITLPDDQVCLELGGIDLGDGLYADVEGNEFRVTISRDAVPRFAAIEIAAMDPHGQAESWSEMFGLVPDGTWCHPPASWLDRIPLYPSFSFVPQSAPKSRKNRIHFDFACRPEDGDFERVLAHGAREAARFDTFATLHDLEGNEFDLMI